MILTIRPGTDKEKREAIVSAWYRQQLKIALPPLIEKWEAVMGVKVNRVFVQRMKTKWGSCHSSKHNIRINSELAQKPPACLEYVVVHELAHLLEPSHNKVFVSLMNQFMPQWRQLRDELNRIPLTHQEWKY
ncbi:MAG: hypothetical protein CO094_00670 [Anaerolineae bacterium CG_4_9_14_3_um_filter_57_17]|nr:M48 family metallopeptidase [bacterium]NCT21190.1 M48 family metallopeptidase [bacterium]OIO84224.1 MAG: hypothetical protein AUK01_09980 [Anaerolineae bacterium CG2_30_57_67]PJB68568.1 MAG: hypothetical protein CO094_00670 [Anaerolineae bacterium CG_4_9_14_3_um_filter_57_17]